MKIIIKKPSSFAKWYLPINIFCVGCLNHVQIAGTNIAIVSTLIYILLLIADILFGQDRYNGGFTDATLCWRTKIAVYLFIVFITLQTLMLYLLNFDNELLNNYVLMVVNLILFLSIIHHTDNYEDLFRYTKCVVVCSIVEILICFYEIRTGLHVRDVALRWYSDVVFGTYYNENDLSVMLALGVLCTVYLISSIKKRRSIKFTIAIIVIALSFYMILKTHARGGLLGFLLIGVLLLLGLLIGRNYDLTGKAFKVGGIIGIIILLLFFASGIFSISNENDVARIFIYSKTISAILNHPIALIFGLGAGQPSNIVGLATHNYVLQMLGEYGIFGVCIYIWLITRMMKWVPLKNASISDTIRKICSFSAALLLLSFGLVTSDFGSIKLSWIVFGIFYTETLHEIRESKERLVIESGKEETINC